MAHQLTSVTCNHCGAPLQIPDTTRFVTCSYCGTRLEVHRSGNAVYTETLAAIQQNTAAMADDLEAIKRQNEIERLDREWQMRRDSLLVRGKNGSVSEPGAAGAIIGAVIATVVGIGVIAAAPGPMKFAGVIFLLVGVVGGISSIVKASEYRDAEQSYLRQRDTLLRSERDSR